LVSKLLILLTLFDWYFANVVICGNYNISVVYGVSVVLYLE